ncbi:uncharacterized protein LOC120718111 [Simochromis diagramma]|uniref:uncharacterized protein LOC120718111 n=1 Tax=Simochromis diagramma TaxID=43689 RepID=UPI001A7E6ABB|nr:uncharacterized protein LOC120718111 [Simochromis diagramma]
MAPMSAAEKQRRYRARRDADPEKRQIYLNKEKEKWRKDREEGKKKKVADLSERQKRAQRKQWRERKRKHRASAKEEDDVERKVKEIIDGPTLVPVKGTMKIHQVLSFSPGTIKYRDITCLCQADKGVLDCECYGLKEISLSQEASPHCTEGPTRPENITKDHIGQWCIINYNGEPYPGIILEVEEDVKVKCMHKNGTNKFHWPSPREDITWYRDDQVVCLMKEPTPLNKKSVQLERKVWDFLEKNWSCWSVA